MAEEHGVAHRAEEGGADERSGPPPATPARSPAASMPAGDEPDDGDRPAPPGRATAGTPAPSGRASLVVAPLDAGRRVPDHGPDPLRLAGQLAPARPATPARRRTTDTASATPAATRPAPTTPASPDRHRVGDGADPHRARRHQQVGPAQQPAVADADLAPAGRHPQEQQPARRPLQQHGGGVEPDHGSDQRVDRRRGRGRPGSAPRARRRWRRRCPRAGSPNRPGDVDAGLDAEGVAGRQRRAVAGDDVGVLVLLDADAVAGAVHELLAPPGRR